MSHLPADETRTINPTWTATTDFSTLGNLEDVAMGFIVGLPEHQGHTVIVVVIDLFSNAAHFGGLPTNFSACKATKLFTNIISKLHGYPKSIISSRDPIF